MPPLPNSCTSSTRCRAGAPQRLRRHAGPGGRVAHRRDYEKPHGRWNRLDLVCLGQTALHGVNGHVNMILTGSRKNVGDREVPLVRGKIQLLSEGAEVFFRTIAYRPIREIPEAFKVPR